MKLRQIAWRALVLCLFAALFAASATAQGWPDRPVHIVVPLTAGSATDVMARTVGQRLAEQLGQAFIVDNKPGAAGTIGVGAVARARPDGYTLLVQSSSYTITPITYPSTPYNTLRDLVGVTPLAVLPQALVVSPNSGIKSVKDLIARAKARPEVLTELLAGRLDYFFCPVNICLPLINDGRLVALAMGSSRRSAVLPDLPTTVELGVPDSNYDFWVGLFVPAATPRDIVDKLHRETVTALANPAVKESLGKLGAEQNVLEPRAFDSEISKEIAANAALVKAAGIPIGSP